MRPSALLSVLAVATIAAGCSVSSERGGTLGEQIGVATPAPDEFLIIARAPIEIPPDLSALPRPQPGTPSRLLPNPFAEAHQTLFGRPQPAPGPASPGGGEIALLGGAGATGDNSAVRAELDAEATPAAERKYGLTSFFGIPIPATLGENDDYLVSPEENERLRAQGLPTPAAPPFTDEDAENERRRLELAGPIYRRQ